MIQVGRVILCLLMVQLDQVLQPDLQYLVFQNHQQDQCCQMDLVLLLDHWHLVNLMILYLLWYLLLQGILSLPLHQTDQEVLYFLMFLVVLKDPEHRGRHLNPYHQLHLGLQVVL